MNCINTLKELMLIKSDDSIRNNFEIINFIKDLFLSCDDIKILSTEDSKNKSMLIGVNTKLDNCSGGLLFSGRINTVYPSNTDFHTYIKEGSIYGPGALCMKYFIACLSQALPRLKKSPKPVIIAFPFVDQSGVTGVKSIISYMQEHSIHPDLCIQGEPTRFSFLVKASGCYQYRMKISCSGGHASMCNVLSSPFYIAAEFVKQIQQLNQDQDLGIVNIAVMEGGRALNQISRQCTVYYDVRTSSLDFKQRVSEIVEVLKQKAEAMGNGMSLNNTILANSVPILDNRHSQWIKRLSPIASSGEPAMHAITEAGFYQEAGIDTLVFGAGDMRIAHSEMEHIKIEDLEKYTEAICSIAEIYNKEMAEVL